MARVLRKVLRLTSVPRAARTCLLLVTVVCIIKIFFFFVRNTWLGPAHSSADVLKEEFSDQVDVPAHDVLWRPPRTRVARVWKELNLSEEEARRHLPVTLDSRLWLNNASLCRDASGHLVPLDILFVVHTVPDRFHRRLLMRSTIAGELHFHPFKIRMVFLVGRVLNNSLQQALKMEHSLYGDTVQGDFLDTDTNLSHKGVLGFRWVWQHCSRARYVVKLDDNVFFDTFKMLLRHRAIFEGRSRSLFCHVLLRDTMHIYREYDHPWAVDENQFQGLNTFPYDYCSGPVVVITSDLIPALFRAAFFTPVFWIEDVYLFGMLPAMVGDVNMVHLGHQYTFIDLNTTTALSCMKRRQERCSVLATVCRTTEEWETFWNLTYSLHQDPGWGVPFLVLPS